MRANLEGAELEGANLRGATLSAAQMDSANLGGADLSGATIIHADLKESYFGGAKLIGADLRGSTLTAANVEEADLTEANLDDADLRKLITVGAKMVRASLRGANLSAVEIANVDLAQADLRKADLRRANLKEVRLTGAKVYAIQTDDANFSQIKADWVDGSPEGDGSQRLTGEQIAAALSGKVAPISAASVPGRRYFGRGDVLRDASLEFGENAFVEIESRFEKCAIVLGHNAQLVIARDGVLKDCNVSGAGTITVHGYFSEGRAPGLKGPSTLVVSSVGSVVSSIEQADGQTAFAFEPGCRLRLKIKEAASSGK